MLTLELRGKDVTKGRLQCCTCTASLCGILGGRGRVAGPGGAGGNLKPESTAGSVSGVRVRVRKSKLCGRQDSEKVPWATPSLNKLIPDPKRPP